MTTHFDYFNNTELKEPNISFNKKKLSSFHFLKNKFFYESNNFNKSSDLFFDLVSGGDIIADNFNFSFLKNKNNFANILDNFYTNDSENIDFTKNRDNFSNLDSSFGVFGKK
jgi:hypothetical protein